MNCIYCNRVTTTAEPVEHVVPEGLVGDQSFMVSANSAEPRTVMQLRLDHGEVCGRCNGALAPLDAYVQKQFGFLKVYWNPVGTKRGTPATAVRPGMFAGRQPDGPFIAVNSESRPVITEYGFVVQPPRDHPEAVRLAEFRVDGSVAEFTIQVPMRMNKRFMRGLHKIAFELLCFQKDADYVLDGRYDPIRRYVRYGEGNRKMVLTMSGDVGTWERARLRLEQIPGRNDWVAVLHLGSAYYIDLTPGNELCERADPAVLRESNMMLWSDAGGGKGWVDPKVKETGP